MHESAEAVRPEAQGIFPRKPFVWRGLYPYHPVYSVFAADQAFAAAKPRLRQILRRAPPDRVRRVSYGVNFFVSNIFPLDNFYS
jgi:hypothetical protein